MFWLLCLHALGDLLLRAWTMPIREAAAVAGSTYDDLEENLLPRCHGGNLVEVSSISVYGYGKQEAIVWSVFWLGY